MVFACTSTRIGEGRAVDCTVLCTWISSASCANHQKKPQWASMLIGEDSAMCLEAMVVLCDT